MATTLFTLNISGPAPGNPTTGSEQWIDLGLIPVGYDYWIGNARYTSPDKSITFELRTNTTAKSISGTSNTTLINTCAVSARIGILTVDLYKNGRLHTKTILSTGVEHWWLRLVSKTSAAGSYLYSINYVKE